MNIIGLGKAGCAIAEKFNQYPQYKIYQIDVDKTGPGCYIIDKKTGPEEYEASTPSFKEFFNGIEGDTIFIVGGSGNISAMSLRILENLKNRKEIDVVYIAPDKTLLSEKRKLHEKVTYNVLQQYARSGAVNRIYLISNPQIENILGDVPIIGYYDKLNDLIVSTLHMINVFKNSNPIMGGLMPSGESKRICTVGIYDMEKDEERLFFSLDSIREVGYIYGVSEERLREDGSLHKRIVSQMKEKTKGETVNVSFGVYSTNYKNDYGYILAYSPNIQS